MKTPFSLISKVFLILTFVCLNSICLLSAQKSIVIHKITEAIDIDGNLEEPVWLDYLQSPSFVQLEPSSGVIATQKTEVAIVYDENYIYIAAILYVNSPEEINSKLTSRDDLGTTDFFGCQMDPFGEAREGYDFSVTAANVQFDEKLTSIGSYSNFNAVWQSAVKLYDEKWTLEMKIPFNSIRFPKEDFSNFRINFQRFSSAKNETSFWNPIDPSLSGYLNQFGRLEGLTNIDPPLNLSFNPFAALSYEKSPNGDEKISGIGGVDMKYVHKNSYTLDVSLIPDFSQAPSDNQVFNLSPFEVQFNENRQFFIEGTEIFDKSGYLYTRRIGGVPIGSHDIKMMENEIIQANPISSNIINLAKLSGKSTNGLSVGVLNGITAKISAILLDTISGLNRTQLTNPLTNYNALVLDKALKNNSSITFVNNSVLRKGNFYDSNLSAILYRWYNAKRNYTISFKKAISQEYRKNEENRFGHEYYAYVAKISGKWTGGISGFLQDEHFNNNDFGYLARNNQFRLRSDIRYNQNTPHGIFNRYNLFADNSTYYYYSLGKMERSQYRVGGYGSLKKNNHSIFADYSYFVRESDFFEPRKKDQHFNRPAKIESFYEYQTNQNKDFSFAGYFILVNFLKSEWYKNQYVGGYGVRARIGQHVFVYFSQSYENIPRSVGFITNIEDEIIFGQRSVQELSNTLSINYAINSAININVRLRHYWIQVDYYNQKSLSKNGTLMSNEFKINTDEYDDNYNSFNVDILATWQFAPASQLSLAYKLRNQFYDENVRSSYFENLTNSINESSSNIVTLKVSYFLDSNVLL